MWSYLPHPFTSKNSSFSLPFNNQNPVNSIKHTERIQISNFPNSDGLIKTEIIIIIIQIVSKNITILIILIDLANTVKLFKILHDNNYLKYLPDLKNVKMNNTDNIC